MNDDLGKEASPGTRAGHASAILEATIRILERESLDAATTTRIAEVAGVSVGSLYHHFADRDAILDALQDREFARALGHMQESSRSENLGARAAARRSTASCAVSPTLYAASPALHRVLAIEGLRVTATDACTRSISASIAIIRGFLAARSDQLRSTTSTPRRSSPTSPCVRRCSPSLLERPPARSRDVIAQLVDLVTRYLVRDDQV